MGSNKCSPASLIQCHFNKKQEVRLNKKTSPRPRMFFFGGGWAVPSILTLDTSSPSKPDYFHLCPSSTNRGGFDSSEPECPVTASSSVSRNAAEGRSRVRRGGMGECKLGRIACRDRARRSASKRLMAWNWACLRATLRSTFGLRHDASKKKCHPARVIPMDTMHRIASFSYGGHRY